MAGDRRDELLEFAHAALSLRWLALAALIALGTLTSAPDRTPTAFYVGILIYTLALSLYAWRYSGRAPAAARMGVILDALAIGVGMRVGSDPHVFLYFGFVTAAVAGLLMTRVYTAAIAGILGLLQLPSLPGSLFGPNRYIAWGVAALALQAAGQVAAVATNQLRRLRAEHEQAIAATLMNVTSGFIGVSRALLRDPAVLWPVLLDQTRAITGAQFAVLALERQDTGTLDVVASRGIGGQAALSFLPGLLAASTDGRLHVAGEHSHAGSAGSRRNAGSSALVVASVPLRLENRKIGAIGLGLPGGVPVSPHQLDAVGTLVAGAVHTARTANRLADIGVLEERRRIAREMHDGLAQTMADAMLQTDLSAMTAQGNPSQVTGDLKELRTLLERGMRELREFMSELRREPLDRGKFSVALEELGREFQRRDEIPTAVVVTGDAARLPSAAKYAILAIVRQALTNVRTHARATAVTIRAEMAAEMCTASVTDNGVGFDLAAFRAQPPGPQHLGLISMEERAGLVGGQLEITTAPGRGTTVTVRIPLGR